MNPATHPFRIGPLELHPDGAIVAGGLPLPNSVALDGTVVEGVRLDKAAGEGEPLYVRLPDGTTVEFVYANGAWTGNGELLHIKNHREFTMQQPFQEGMIQGPKQPWKNPATWVAVVLIAAVAVVTAVYLLKPLQDAFPALTPPVASQPSRIHESPPPTKADPVLIAKVRSAHINAANRLTELRTAYDKLDSAFRDSLGFSLEASAKPENYPRTLVDLMTSDNPPSREWTELRNAAIPDHVFQEKRAILNSIEGKLRDEYVTLTDQHDLEDLAAWAGEKLARLVGQSENLTELAAALSQKTATRTGETP